MRANDVAVIGLSCRFPGASNPHEFWDVLRGGLEVTGSMSLERSCLDPRRQRVTEAGLGQAREGFIEDAAQFDARFFNLSPREARSMDPRQRLALELAWELLEAAAASPESVAGERFSVFIGAMNDDYAYLSFRNEANDFDHHSFTGLSRGMIANRISYAFGLHGPSFTIDCGQSSSLVAVHLACESLRTGESSLAIAGGVHLNLAAEIVALESKFGGLSPSGHIYAFDERADGYVRGEGGGMVLLKPLHEAIADGDRIHAVIRGSAVGNAGGRAPGLTVPSIAGQLDVLQRAYELAEVSRTEVDYVELHGTGTKVGDPIEAAALGQFFTGRECPLLVGSAKTNIGHLEGAAGIAGLIKTVLAIENSEIPASLNFQQANPQIGLGKPGLRVNSAPTLWPTAGGGPRRAGVSSFGMGGTNAHVILEQAPVELADLAAGSGSAGAGLAVVPWAISGKSVQALAAQADRLRAHLETNDDEFDPLDVGRSLASRSTFEHRAVVVGSDRQQLLAGLAVLASGDPGMDVVTGRARRLGKTVMVFPGQGSQWVGMGAELLDSSPVFAEQMRRCGEALGQYVEWSLLDVVRGTAGAPGICRVDVVQPVLWALMVSLAQMWASVGVVPDAVIGHSQGEIAAAYVAGGLSLEDAARTVASRSQLLRRLSGTGAMVSVAARLPQVGELMAAGGDRLSIAAVNGVAAVVVSGDEGACEELLRRCAADGVRAHRIDVDYASHSAQVDVIRDDLIKSLSGIRPRPCNVAFISTTTGDLFDTSGLDAGYWYQNVRRPVQFEAAVRTACGTGHSVFIEASPHPVLGAGIEDTVADCLADSSGVVVPSLERDDGGLRRFWMSVGQAHVAGVRMDWPTVFEDCGGRLVELPTYAFQRRRFWLDNSGTPVSRDVARSGSVEQRCACGELCAHESVPVSREHDLATLDPAARRAAAHDLIVDEVCSLLEYTDRKTVADNGMFNLLGVDSSIALKLRRLLIGKTGISLPSAVIYDYPSIRDLANYVAEKIAYRYVAAPILSRIDEIRRELTMITDETARSAVIESLEGLLNAYSSPAESLEDMELAAATDDELFRLVDEKNI